MKGDSDLTSTNRRVPPSGDVFTPSSLSGCPELVQEAQVGRVSTGHTPPSLSRQRAARIPGTLARDGDGGHGEL